VSLERLQGARVVVTGAGSGIGLATLRRARSEGARVAGLDLDVTALADESGVPAAACDVTDAAALGSALDELAGALGGLDGVVAAAGILAEQADAVTLPLAAWERTLAVNLTGVFLTVRAAIPHLRRAGGGSIVLIASQLGLVGQRGTAAYCASKGGVVMLGKALALDHADEGIRVNVVCPGPIDTPMNRGAPAEVIDAIVAANIPVGRVGEPEEVAALIAYLLSSESSYTTGSVIAIDGGWTAR
jgi:NAD(P)-dependent dehydrogenase (short-subunit alcohol dehydrogenase family)